MLLLKPLSVSGKTPDYQAVLPAPSLAVCGTQGVYVAVGYLPYSNVYRGTWDERQQNGSWNFAYHKDGPEGLVKE